MNSELYKLHVAIFPSLQAINLVGGGDLLIKAIEGSFSRNIKGYMLPHKSKFVKTLYDKFYERAIIAWKASQDKNGLPVTVKEFLKDIAKDGIPDVMIKEVTFVVPYTTYDRYTMQNQTFYKEWTFRPYTFRKTVWERLKAKDFPSKQLYLKILEIKRNLKKELNPDTYKRWRDVLLFNEPHPELDNNDIRSIWMGRPFALLLKETRGKFELMDLGELKK